MKRTSLKIKGKQKHGRELGIASILNRRIIRQFCKLAREGRTMDTICDYLGIQPSTFWKWCRRGEKYINGGGQPKGHKLCGLFVMRLRRATALYRMDVQRKLETAGKNTWIKYMAILERRDRKNFSRNELPGGGEEAFDSDERFV